MPERAQLKPGLQLRSQTDASVVANWFQAKLGIAMAVAIAGVSAGGMIIVQVADTTIHVSGWRTAYVVLALPILLIVLPLVLLFVRTHPFDAFIQGSTSETELQETEPLAVGLARSVEGFTSLRPSECARSG